VDVVALQPFRVVVMSTQGSYSTLDKVYCGLYEWMAQRGVVESIEGIWGVPQHDRRDTPEAEYAFDCCLATSAQPPAGDGVTLGDLGGGEFLRCLHQGSFDLLEESLDALLLELLSRPELQLRDAPILQEYLNDPDVTPVDELRTQVYLPVSHAQTDSER
jgi:AraC family transcriptional regulator